MLSSCHTNGPPPHLLKWHAVFITGKLSVETRLPVNTLKLRALPFLKSEEFVTIFAIDLLQNCVPLAVHLFEVLSGKPVGDGKPFAHDVSLPALIFVLR